MYYRDHLPHDHAYGITACFGGEINQNQNIIAKLQGFLSDKGFLKATKPLHDTFAAFSLPKNKQNITLKKWQDLISKHGKEAMELFAIADKIEAKKAENTAMQNIAPKDLNDAILLHAKLTYVRAAQYPELAELALKYKLSEEEFNKSLNVEKQKKKSDNLPNITIHGKDIDYKLESDTSLNQYHLVKLPIDDPRAYILGHIVNDCQSIDGDSKKCVIDGITKENNGFYVLLKNKNSAKQNSEIFTSEGKIDYKNFEIVGQAYAWLSKIGNLGVDSWENLRNEDTKTKALNDDEVIIPILQEFAKQICETTNIDRVTIGLGGKTPESFNHSKINFPETMLEGYNYGDARNQALVGEKSELTELKTKINKHLTQTEYKFEIDRIDRAKTLLNLIENEQSFNDLLGCSNLEQLKLLNLLVTSADLKNFNYNYFEKFSNLETDKITHLLSDNALQGYEKKFFSLEQLKELDVNKIEHLRSGNALRGYAQKFFSLEQLKELDADKIKVLISKRVLEGYSKNIFTFNDIKNLNVNLIEILTDIITYEGYKKNYFTFNDLKNLDIQKIKILTNDDVLKGYENKYFTLNDFKDLNIDKFTALTCVGVAMGLQKKYFTFDDIKDLNVEKIKALTASNAINSIYGKLASFNDIKDLSIDIIQTLTSNEALKKYWFEGLKFKSYKESLEKLDVTNTDSKAEISDINSNIVLNEDDVPILGND